MKKKLIISIFVLTVSSMAAFSQPEPRPRPFELGIFGSPALNWLNSGTDGYNNKGLAFSGSYGLNLDINMFHATSNYYLHTGINIRHISGKLSYNDYYDGDTTLSRPIESKFNMTYISIPTALKLQTNPLSGRYIVYSIFGLDNSFCVAATRRDKVGESSLKPKDDMDNTSRFREALMVSIGGEYIISNNTRISVGLMFNNGFTNLFKKNFYNQYTFAKTGKKEKVYARNRTLELQVGLTF